MTTQGYFLSKPNEKGHYQIYCDHCECATVICGKCGNNTCNGGYGEIPGPEPFTMIQCDACESAYDLYKKEDNGNI